jgi:hypothetical protein
MELTLNTTCASYLVDSIDYVSSKTYSMFIANFILSTSIRTPTHNQTANLLRESWNDSMYLTCSSSATFSLGTAPLCVHRGKTDAAQETDLQRWFGLLALIAIIHMTLLPAITFLRFGQVLLPHLPA